MDVSAILLSLGETSLAEARRALGEQTLALREIHLVEGVSPFAEAFRIGLEQVRTPFFLQCDADMLLYPHCLERLAEGVEDSTGLVVGHLNDPLQGPILGVKLFRSQPCREARILSEPNCEVRQKERIEQQGWSVKKLEEVLGSHQLQPREAAYQFERFRLLGSKCILRRNWWDATHRLLQLSQRQQLPVAGAATAGLLAGLTLGCAEQIHGPPQASAEYERWRASSPGESPPPEPASSPFESGWRCGAEQGLHRGWVRHYLELRNPSAWLFLAGYLAACLDPLARPAAALWPQIEAWAAYLERKLVRWATTMVDLASPETS